MHVARICEGCYQFLVRLNHAVGGGDRSPLSTSRELACRPPLHADIHLYVYARFRRRCLRAAISKPLYTASRLRRGNVY